MQSDSDKIQAIADELVVIRGPVPLVYRGPVDGGILGGFASWVSKFKKALAIVALALSSGGLTGLLTVRSSLIDQGRAIERRAQDEEIVKDLRVQNQQLTAVVKELSDKVKRLEELASTH